MILTVHVLPNQPLSETRPMFLSEPQTSLPAQEGNMLRAEHFMVGIHPGNITSGYCGTALRTQHTHTNLPRESTLRLYNFTLNPQNREENWNCSTHKINNKKIIRVTNKQASDLMVLVYMSSAVTELKNDAAADLSSCVT